EDLSSSQKYKENDDREKQNNYDCFVPKKKVSFVFCFLLGFFFGYLVYFSANCFPHLSVTSRGWFSSSFFGFFSVSFFDYCGYFSVNCFFHLSATYCGWFSVSFFEHFFHLSIDKMYLSFHLTSSGTLKPPRFILPSSMLL
ncbi:MAG: uncharacterized protein A8A55_3600, partial [Amphiamblys sp. WSBS2006]